jgi:hypothetical protein
MFLSWVLPGSQVVAALEARAGARVRLIDRATFPRDKLCSDTVSPGTWPVSSLGIAEDIAPRLRVDGMLDRRARCRDRGELSGRHLRPRDHPRDLDWLLLQRAIAAGCQFEEGIARAARSRQQPPAEFEAPRLPGGPATTARVRHDRRGWPPVDRVRSRPRAIPIIRDVGPSARITRTLPPADLSKVDIRVPPGPSARCGGAANISVAPVPGG